MASESPLDLPDEDPFPPEGLTPTEPPREREARLRSEYSLGLALQTPATWCTYVVLAALVGVYAWMVAGGVDWWWPRPDDLVRWGANYPPRTTRGEWWRLFTAMWVHIGILHLAVDLLFLHSIGPRVERLVGNAGFLLIFVFSGLATGIASSCLNPRSACAGAGGGLFGLYGAMLGYLVRRGDSVPRSVIRQTRNGFVSTLIANSLLFGAAWNYVIIVAPLLGFAAGFLCGTALSRPFGARARQGRLVRNALAGGVGLALIAGACPLLPRVFDLAPYISTENAVTRRYNEVWQQVQAKEIGDDQFLRALEEDLLPRWRTLLSEVTRDSSDTTSPRVTKFKAYAEARLQWWESLAEGLRTHDPSIGRRAARLREQSEEALRQFDAASGD